MDREILSRFSKAVGSGRPVWDLGCGPGQATRYLKDLGLSVSGLDLSGKTIELARKNHPGIEFCKGNILSLEFADRSLAGITAFYAIVYFTEEQVDLAFREVFRVLEPGGLFLLTFHIGTEKLHTEEFLGHEIDIDFMYFTTRFIAGSLKKSGFTAIEVIEREPYPDVEYRSRRAYVFAVKPGPGLNKWTAAYR